MGAADAGFEHAAAPDGNVILYAYVVDLFGFGKASNPANLDIDDAASATLHRAGGIAGIFDRLVQADGGPQFLLETGMVVDIVVPQGLLDHQQIELIELAQLLEFVERVGGVRVDAQQDVRPAGAHFLEDVEIPAGLDLQLDAPIAGIEFSLNFLQQLLGRILNANRDAAGDFLARTAQQLPQGQLAGRGLRIPEGVFQRGLSHTVSAHPRHQGGSFPTLLERTSQEHGSQVVLGRHPGAFNPFAAVERILTGNALRPTGEAVAVNRHEQNAPAVGATKARLEEVDERHLNLAQGDGFDFHGGVAPAGAECRGFRCLGNGASFRIKSHDLLA